MSKGVGIGVQTLSSHGRRLRFLEQHRIWFLFLSNLAPRVSLVPPPWSGKKRDPENEIGSRSSLLLSIIEAVEYN